MKRRTVLAALSGGTVVTLTGCLGTTGTGGTTRTDGTTTTGTPAAGPLRTTSQSLTVGQVDCGSEANQVTVRVSATDSEPPGGTVTVAGVIEGNNGCVRARLDDVSVEDGTLVVSVGTFDAGDPAESCIECIVDVPYEATIEFVGGSLTAGDVRVRHDGTVVDRSDTRRNDTTTDRRPTDGLPAIDRRSFEVTSNQCGTGTSRAAVSFDVGYAEPPVWSVIVEGTIPGADACHTARLEAIRLDGDRLVVSIVAVDEGADRACAQCLVDIDYQARVTFERGPGPSSVVVRHDDRTVTTATP